MINPKHKVEETYTGLTVLLYLVAGVLIGVLLKELIRI